jgi:NitT/TauT family transport system substrate-binding protein
MTALNLMVSRHSAFYSPLIAGIAGGFFQAEGFKPTYRVVPAGRTIGEFIAAGEVHVAQSAVSASWAYLERNAVPPFTHFAQVNQRDGFLLAARKAPRKFDWKMLLDGQLMYVHRGQPQAMLAYALHLKGMDLAKVRGIDSGGTEQMMAAFRAGEGDFFHEQAPYPQQLEQEGRAHVVASVGEVIGQVAFSSLAASPQWLSRPEANLFMRAYRQARLWTHCATPDEIATAEQSFFPGIAPEALARSIAFYQKLGTWDGPVLIEREPYEVALDVFLHSRLIARRHAYAEVVRLPPD